MQGSTLILLCELALCLLFVQILAAYLRIFLIPCSPLFLEGNNKIVLKLLEKLLSLDLAVGLGL